MDEVVKCRLQGWRVTKPLAGKRLVQKKWLEASSEASHFPRARRHLDRH
jgi:hypothetical protein